MPIDRDYRAQSPLAQQEDLQELVTSIRASRPQEADYRRRTSRPDPATTSCAAKDGSRRSSRSAQAEIPAVVIDGFPRRLLRDEPGREFGPATALSLGTDAGDRRAAEARLLPWRRLQQRLTSARSTSPLSATCSNMARADCSTAVDSGVIPPTIAMEIARAMTARCSRPSLKRTSGRQSPGNQVLAIRRIIEQRSGSRASI